ncbi:MAG: hypothetical protein Q4D58_11065 [Synergistaceae bacterium]|nr:hypothetical protein [Synergistaceae bacterium]
MKRRTMILFLAILFSVMTSTSAGAISITADDAQEIKAAALSVDITTTAVPTAHPLSSAKTSVTELTNIIAAKSSKISALNGADSLSSKTGVSLGLGHVQYPPVSGDFASKVQFTLFLDGFNKSFENTPYVFVPVGGMNALDDKPASTDILGVKAVYDAAGKTLTFSLDPASNYFDIDGDSYLLAADVKYTPHDGGGSGGGCNTGNTAFLLPVLLPVFRGLVQKRKK